jgi:predicted transcriptional regulator
MPYTRFMQDANLTIRIPSDLKARLQERADVESRTVTQIVVKALQTASNRWATATTKKEA